MDTDPAVYRNPPHFETLGQSTSQLSTLNASARQQICRKLDIEHPLGGDYQTLASNFNMSAQDIQTISQKPNPTDNVLAWMGRRRINTIAMLRMVLVTMERDDCVKIIDESLQSEIDNIESLAIGKCVVVRVIGSGSFGEVRLCQTVDRERNVAVKQVDLRKIKKERQEAVENLIKTMAMLIKLKNNNIANFYSYEQTVTEITFCMEYVSGGSVFDYLQKNGEMQEKLVRKFTYQILKGCEYLHRNNVIHIDIRGKNVLIDDAKESIRLADFGIAIDLEKILRSTDSSSSKITIGTVFWCSPEYLNNEDPSYVFDIWSVACTVVQMLTGKPPLADLELSFREAMDMIVQREYKPRDDLSSLAKKFIALCFQEKEDRPDATASLENDFPSEYLPRDEDSITNQIAEVIKEA